MELKLEWSEIFRRLVVEKRGGVCYERDEVLYQGKFIILFFINFLEKIEAIYEYFLNYQKALKYIGFEAYRIECMARAQMLY